MSLKEEVAKNNALFTIGRTMCVILGFVFSIVLARIMQPHDFGLYSFCLVVVSFFILFTDLGLKNILTRFSSNYMSRKEYGKLRSLFRKIFRYKLYLSLIASLGTIFLSDYIALFVFGKPEAGFVILFSGIIILFNSILKIFHSFLSGMKNFGILVLLDILENIFKFLFVLGAVVIGMGIGGALSGLVAVYISLVAVSSVFVYSRYRFVLFGPKGKLKGDILINFGKWIFVSSIVDRIYGVIDQMMISGMLLVENVGFYRIAHTWMSSIICLVPIAGTVLHPYFSGAKNKGQLKSMFFLSFRYASIFIFPLAACLSVYSEPIIHLFYGSSFLPAAPALSILAVNSVLLCFHGMLLSYFVGISRPDITTKVSLATISLNIILNYFLISNYGILGAAVATVTSLLVTVCILFYIAFKKEGMHFDSGIILKPLLSSVVVYAISNIYFVDKITTLWMLVFYGVMSVVIYIVIMFIIKGLSKEDVDYARKGLGRITGFSL